MIDVNESKNNTGLDCFVIAEAGVNHNGSLKIAKKLVDSAKDCKVDAIKFQTFHADKIVSITTKKAEYQTRAKETSQYDMLKNLELSFDEFRELKDYCDKKQLEFISTPYDVESVYFLDDLGVSRIKIASADIINKPLIEAAAKTNKQIILGCGMASLSEIERTVSHIKNLGNNDIVLLHCTTSYPAKYEEVNMKVLKSLKTNFNLPVGYSDHTIGWFIPIMAVSFGARMIEKHFTLDRKMVGPDHFASIEPKELAHMVEAIKLTLKAIGKEEKALTPEEKKNILYMRRSLHLVNNKKKGDPIFEEDLKITRPFDGIEPWYIEDVVGKMINKDKNENEPILWEDF